jgi:hypothetical protein
MNPEKTSAPSSKLATGHAKAAALRAALHDPRLSLSGRATVRQALAKQEAVVRYRQNLPTR